MKLKILIFTLAYLASCQAKVTVVSTMCQTKEDGYLRWMKCPLESYGSADSKREFLDDMNTSEHEQKFCCGDLEHRFCCSFAEKLREVPDFDPSGHKDGTVRYRVRHEHFHFFHYLIFIGLSVLCIGVISYIFGCVIFEILYCLCCCCRPSKKKSTKDYKDPTRQPRRSPYPDNNVETLIVTSNPHSNASGPPPNYQSIAGSRNFGGTADLYQDVTTTLYQTPPSYSDVNQK